MERIQGRFIEDVRDFTVEFLDNHITESVDKDCGESYIALVQSTRDKIANGRMLDKVEAKWLGAELNSELRLKMDTYDSSQFIIKVDSWGIYSDAWGLYCRPGTYITRF